MTSYVFGPPGGTGTKASEYSTDSSDSSDCINASRENPLLTETVTTNGVIGHRNGRRFRRAETGRAISFCGCIGHLLILFLPMIAMVFTIAFLILLLVFDRTQIQQNEIYGGEDYQEIAKIYYASVSSDTISLVMSQYEPYREVMALSSVSCVLVTMVTVARNIQIEVYQKRTGSIIFMKFINYLSAIINILSYVGLMVAVNFKVTQEEPEYAVTAHFIGFLTFFAGTATYAVLHSFLLWNQSEYPTFIKVIFYLLAVVQVAASLAFGIPIWQGGLSSDDDSEPIFEWVAVFASALSIGLYVVLFFVDPVDDELGFFFCGGHEKRTRASRGRRAGRQPLQQQDHLQSFSA